MLVDPRAVDPASVRVRQRFGLFHLLGAQFRVRNTGGVLLSYRYTLECVVPGCLPGRTLAERRFLPALVSYRTVAGRKRRAVIDVADVHRRHPPVDFGHRRPDTAPARRRAASAGQLPDLAAHAAGAARRAGGGARPRCRGARRRRAAAAPAAPTGPKLPPLEEALALVRASTLNGHNGERRRALGRLARVLRVEGQGELAGAAVRLAWSSDPPSADATSELADEVEASL